MTPNSFYWSCAGFHCKISFRIIKIPGPYLEDKKNKMQKLAQWVKLVKMVKHAELVQRLTMVKLVEMAQTDKTHKLAYWSNEPKWFVFNI